jgi:hypothetical protein
MSARTRGRDGRGNLNRFSSRIARFAGVLEEMGIAEEFAAMPRRFQEIIVQRKFPDPVIEFDETFPSDEQHRALAKMLGKQFDEARIEVEGTELAVKDYLAIVPALRGVILGTINQANVPPTCMEFVRAAQPVVERWLEEEYLMEVGSVLHRAVIVPLVGRSRLDGRMLFADLCNDSTPQQKVHVRMTVSSTVAPSMQVIIDGKPRPAVRVGTSNEYTGVRWATWDGKPLVIQSHALRQLRSRVNLPFMADYLEAWLERSLAQPVIVEGPRAGAAGSVMVEYRIHDQRLGYVVLTPTAEHGGDRGAGAGGVAVVRTFLFLTMQGTPEARMLQQRLRLSRRDVEWLKLDDLAAFTQTDLREDDQLRGLLQDCGCGHLFDLAEDGRFGEASFAPQPKPLAAEVRKYLRMAA